MLLDYCVKISFFFIEYNVLLLTIEFANVANVLFVVFSSNAVLPMPFICLKITR